MKLDQKGSPGPKQMLVVVGMLLILLTFTLSFIPRSPTSAATPTPTERHRRCKYYYRVQPGDTITSIGQLYGIDWRLIASANNLAEPYVLTPGERLCIPGGTAPEVTESETGESTITARQEPTGSVIGGFNHVYLKLEHFPKNRSYNVIVRPETTYLSYRINCFTLEFPAEFKRDIVTQCRPIHTDENGAFEGWLRVPNSVPSAHINQLCIKNTMTDETLCTNFEDPEYYIERAWYTTHKFGR